MSEEKESLEIPVESGEAEPDLQPLEWEGETVLGPEAVLERGARFGMYVNTNRALPDIRDGLKPVQRRILHSMLEAGLRYERKPRKSTRVMGDCFLAGSQVLTPHGPRAIQEIGIGDWVCAPSGEPVRVKQTYLNPASAILTVRLENGLQVGCTPGQRFRVIGRAGQLEWCEAHQLRGRELALSSDCQSSSSPVLSVEPAGHFPHYDIQVESEDHTFIVEGMLAHNCMGKYHPHGDSSIYNAMVAMAQEFNNNTPLIHGKGNWGCFTGETQLRLMDGSIKSFKQLAELPPEEYFWVYSVDKGGEIVAGKGRHARCTSQHARILEVVLEDSQVIRCTPDHRFLLLDGSYKEAAHLTERDSLFPLSSGAAKVAGVRLTAAHAEVYDITVDEHHNFLLEAGVFVHNSVDNDPAAAARYCVIGETRVRLADGRSVRIEALVENARPNHEYKIDERVLDHKGRAVSASRFFHSGEHPTLRVRTREGYQLTGTANHPVLCLSQSSPKARARLVWKVMAHLRPGDQIAIACHQTRDETPLTPQEFSFIASQAPKDRFPESIWQARPALKRGFLYGLLGMEHSQSLSGNAWIIGEKSLAREAHKLLLELGLVSRLEQTERGEQRIIAAKKLPSQPYFYSQVSEISDGGVQPVYSIRVDTEDHSFLTDGFISHNTECKLSAAVGELFTDNRAEIVPFKLNYDESTTEPEVLPVPFPIGLVNGTEGPGWAMACSIPPHNLGEVMDALILLAEKPGADLKAIMRRLSAPDFPSGGIIPDPEGLAKAYQNGRGTFRLQAKYHVENVRGGQQAVVITELPYQVAPSRIIEEIIQEARGENKAKVENITEITESPSNQVSREGIRLVVKCKRNGNLQRLIAQLLKHTSMEQTRKVNFTVLQNGVPLTVSLPTMLSAFVDFRREVVTKRLEHERETLLRALHSLVAQRAAIAPDVIERVIKLIRASKNDESTRAELQKLVRVPANLRAKKGKSVPIDAEQAQFIMNLRLRRLNQLNRFELEQEIESKLSRVLEIDAILKLPASITKLVCDEFRETKKRHSAPRRTVLAQEGRGLSPAGPLTPTASLPKTDVSVYASRSGLGVAALRPSKASTVPLTLGASDRMQAALHTDTEASIHLFSSSGMAYRLRVAEIPIASRKERGSALAALSKEESLVSLLPVEAGPYLLLLSALGKAKRIESSLLKASHAGGLPVIGLPEGDRLIAVIPHTEEEILVHTRSGRALRFSPAKLRPVKTGSAGGVGLLRLRPDDQLLGGFPLRGEKELLILHQSGMSKRVRIEEYSRQGTGGQGLESAKPELPKRAPAGPLAAVFPLPAGKEPTRLLSARGGILSVNLHSAPAGARGAKASEPFLEPAEDDFPLQLL